MKKRGMSNIVATVLLVSSTIAIAILIFVWISHSIGEETDKSGDTSTAESVCKDIEIRIKEAYKTPDPGVISVTVENLNNREINALRIRLESAGQVETKKITGKIDGYESKKFTVLATEIPITSQSIIKVIPEIILEKPEISADAGRWLCSNKAVEASIQ